MEVIEDNYTPTVEWLTGWSEDLDCTVCHSKLRLRAEDLSYDHYDTYDLNVRCPLCSSTMRLNPSARETRRLKDAFRLGYHKLIDRSRKPDPKPEYTEAKSYRDKPGVKAAQGAKPKLSWWRRLWRRVWGWVSWVTECLGTEP